MVEIRTPDQRLRVFVSSTLEELADERRSVSRAISALRLTPVLFELGARPHPPRELYRSYLAQSDVFIGLYWQRYGQIPPGGELSALEDEFELSRGLPRLLYVKAPASDRDPRLGALLSRIEREASYRVFRSPAELGRLVRDDLATLLSERFTASGPALELPPATPVPRAPPAVPTALIGRDKAIDDVTGLLAQPEVRMVTLTGPGGIGKTRLALAVGERLRARFDAGTAFVSLEDVREREQVPRQMAHALGASLLVAAPPLETLEEVLGTAPWLLILDNLERVLDAARDIDRLLASCPGLSILGTSLIALRLRAEREYPVPPLGLPSHAAAIDELAASPAVALFVDRARAVRPDFALTPANVAAVAEICRRLEGLPLAIELAAARTRLLHPDALLARLASSLDALGTGTVDLPERQHTLRATVEWSVGMLEPAEHSLLEAAAVFEQGWTVDAAAEVVGLDEGEALDLEEALARHSLISIDVSDDGPRARMLDTIRAFVRERLASRPDHDAILRRHADYFRKLADRADRPMRRGDRGRWVERLQAETANLVAAVRWYMAHDREPLPHLFRVLAPWLLWPFLGLRAPTGEVRSWIDELLPTADSLDPLARAELLWPAILVALETSDDQAALAARDQLVAVIDEVDDTYLRAVTQLSLSWTSVLVRDLDRAFEEASLGLQRLRGQDEPLWTAVALETVGALETARGRYDAALGALTEFNALAERLHNDWLAASSIMQLGVLSMRQGRLEEARATFDRALDRSLAADHTDGVTVGLVAFARLALAEGDVERAALLLGAADGLRRRGGLRVWTSVRGEDQLAAEIRDALGRDEFDRAFASGSRLNRSEAVAAARLSPQPSPS